MIKDGGGGVNAAVFIEFLADTVGRVAVAGKDDFRRKVRSSVRQLQNDPKKFAPSIRIRPERFHDFTTLND